MNTENGSMTSTFHHLIIARPLAVIDLETSGVNDRNDHIVEVGVLYPFTTSTRRYSTSSASTTSGWPTSSRAAISA